jgi:uncharacterized protein (TIGR01777 family)
MRVVVTGGTGFIGVRLVSRLKEKGYDVDVLSRRARPGRLPQNVRIVPWAEGTSWESAVDGAEGIVNLAGENVARRWTAPAKNVILGSRLDAIAKLSAAIEKATRRPAALVNASAVGYYGGRGDDVLTEEAAPGDCFLARTCVAWEGAARALESFGLRVVRIRIGVVLAAEGGALAKMLPVFKAFVGGPVGGGGQWMSWIHRDDLVELIVFALENPLVDGVLNGTAPNPVSNRDFASALGKALRRPAIVPAPAAAVKLLLGEMATVVLDGQRVVPKRALDLGFRFRFPELGPALRDALGT